VVDGYGKLSLFLFLLLFHSGIWKLLDKITWGDCGMEVVAIVDGHCELLIFSFFHCKRFNEPLFPSFSSKPFALLFFSLPVSAKQSLAHAIC
jgi:hypothetical protein